LFCRAEIKVIKFMIIFLISLFIAILLQSSITTLPLVLLIILFLAVINRTNDVFAVAFFAGLLLDIITMGRIGFSSLFFVIFVFLIFLYQRKFEIETLYFIIIFSFAGSFIYLFLTDVRFVLMQSLFSACLVTFSFIAYKKFNKKLLTYA